jgi:putative NADPH-quinone reductase
MISISKNETLNDGAIHDSNTKLKVKAIDLLRSRFTPSKGEVQFFVTAGEEKLAFETEGYKKHRQLLILQMISSYCVYLGLMEAQIHSTRPSYTGMLKASFSGVM